MTSSKNGKILSYCIAYPHPSLVITCSPFIICTLWGVNDVADFVMTSSQGLHTNGIAQMRCSLVVQKQFRKMKFDC